MSIKIVNSPSLSYSPSVLVGGLLPGSIPNAFAAEAIVNKYINNMLPATPKLPDVKKLKKQILRYASSALTNDQYAVLLAFAKGGGASDISALLTKMKWAGMTTRI